jgi:hypothetical protein
VAFTRFRAADHAHTVTPPLTVVPRHDHHTSRVDRIHCALSVPPLAVDLDAGPRRLKPAAIRRTAPEVLLTAKTQRWAHEEALRTLVETATRRRKPPTSSPESRPPGFPSPSRWTRSTWQRPQFNPSCSATLQPGMNSHTTEPGDHRTRRNRQLAHPDRPPGRRDPRRAPGPLLHRRPGGNL